MTDYSTAQLALALDRALTMAGPDLKRVLPPNFPVQTFVNRSVRALLVEFDSFDHCMSFAGGAAEPMAPEPQQDQPALPAHDPTTGEILEPAPAAPEAAPEPEYDGPEADAPAASRPMEMDPPVDEADEPPPVEDLGRARIEAFAKHIEKMFTGPADVWREMSRGVPDGEVPRMVRIGNASLIDSAQHHHPDLFKQIKATLDRGRVAP